jgi:hypothetical protein
MVWSKADEIHSCVGGTFIMCTNRLVKPSDIGTGPGIIAALEICLTDIEGQRGRARRFCGEDHLVSEIDAGDDWR